MTLWSSHVAVIVGAVFAVGSLGGPALPSALAAQPAAAVAPHPLTGTDRQQDAVRTNPSSHPVQGVPRIVATAVAATDPPVRPEPSATRTPRPTPTPTRTPTPTPEPEPGKTPDPAPTPVATQSAEPVRPVASHTPTPTPTPSATPVPTVTLFPPGPTVTTTVTAIARPPMTVTAAPTTAPSATDDPARDDEAVTELASSGEHGIEHPVLWAIIGAASAALLGASSLLYLLSIRPGILARKARQDQD